MSEVWQPRMGRFHPTRRQRGAAMVEFALVFPILFFLIYSLLGYGLLFLLEQNITLAAEEGARAAIAVDPEAADYLATVKSEAREVVLDRLNWLPENQRNVIASNITVNVNDENVATVTVTYPNYAGNPIIPSIHLPGFGSVPPYPVNVHAEASIQL